MYITEEERALINQLCDKESSNHLKKEHILEYALQLLNNDEIQNGEITIAEIMHAIFEANKINITDPAAISKDTSLKNLRKKVDGLVQSRRLCLVEEHIFEKVKNQDPYTRVYSGFHKLVFSSDIYKDIEANYKNIAPLYLRVWEKKEPETFNQRTTDNSSTLNYQSATQNQPVNTFSNQQNESFITLLNDNIQMRKGIVKLGEKNNEFITHIGLLTEKLRRAQEENERLRELCRRKDEIIQNYEKSDSTTLGKRRRTFEEGEETEGAYARFFNQSSQEPKENREIAKKTSQQQNENPNVMAIQNLLTQNS